jgi:hypothetical protein
MSEKKIHCLNNCRATPCNEQSVLNLTLLCNSDNACHYFRIPSGTKISAFLDLALAKLSEGDGAERVEALKQYYQPILELLREDGSSIELPSHLSLAQTELSNGATVRIAAHPLKERIMFCSHG